MISQEALVRRVARLRRRLKGIRSRRAFFANPDLCLWLQRTFQVGWRRFVRHGEERGFLVIRMGWIVATVRW